MEWNSIKNNIFLYLLSLSNAINYIFYFPFILLYLVESNDLKNIDFIKIYIFFIIYDLVRNVLFFIIRKIIYCFGINKKITLDLMIITLISMNIFYLLLKFDDKSFFMNIFTISRIVFSLTNISSMFISTIVDNIFEKKERFNKLNIFDFYEKFNNFMIILFFFMFINSFDRFYLYFFGSSIFNLLFCIIYILMFKCHDEKVYLLYEEQDINKSTKISSNNKKNVKIKNNRIQKVKGALKIEDDQYLSKSNNKDALDNKYRKTPSETITDIKLRKKFSNKTIELENNDNALSTKYNQIITNKELTNMDIIKNNENIENNIPIASSNRDLNEHIKKSESFAEMKNEKILNKKKWTFICFILVPSKFLKYLFLIMLFIKSYSLKNIFEIRIQFIFYCCYFFMNILIYPMNKKVFSKILKTKSGKKKMNILSIVFAVPACLGYIYLLLDDPLDDPRFLFEKYIIFFVLNFILKECIYTMLRIYYINSISIGFSKNIFKNMKEISNILTCIIFIGYNIALLYIKNKSITRKIINYACYYFFPVSCLLIFFINTIKISK
jgi:hypothetical protein